jgi:hypothetical protein
MLTHHYCRPSVRNSAHLLWFTLLVKGFKLKSIVAVKDKQYYSDKRCYILCYIGNVVTFICNVGHLFAEIIYLITSIEI